MSKPHEKTFFWDRVVRPNIRKSGHVVMDLCTTEGTFERRIVAKSHSVAGGYRVARKAKWGDLWRFGKRIPHKFRKEGTYGKRLW